MVKDLSSTHNSEKDFEGQSDGFIWDCFTKGDKAAFTCIYKTYANMLYNYGAKFTDDKKTLEYCLQSFFIYINRNRQSFELKYSIKHFFLKSFRLWVKQYLEDEADDTKCEPEGEFQLKLTHRENTPNRAYEINERIIKERIEEMISDLHSNQREAIFLFYHEQLEYAEIGDILGLIPESSDVKDASGGAFDFSTLFMKTNHSIGSLYRKSGVNEFYNPIQSKIIQRKGSII